MTKFLKILDSEAEHFHFQVFDDSKMKTVQPQTIVGSLEETVDLLAIKNKAGAGVFVAIQPHPIDKPRKAEFTIRVRTFLIDLDGSPLEPVLKTLENAGLTPNMVINTSTDKYHVYIKVSDCPLDQYSAVQKALALKFGGDPCVNDLPRVARVVGSIHRKDPDKHFKVNFHSIGSSAPYTFDKITNGLNLDLNLNIKKHIDNESDVSSIHTGNIAEGERNSALFAVARRMRALNVPEAEIKNEIQKANDAQCIPPLFADEVDAIFQSALKYKPDQVPFEVITNENAGGIARVVRCSGINELTADSSADVIDRVLYKAVGLSNGMKGSSQVLLKGEIKKKLKSLGISSPAELVKHAFPAIKQEEEDAEPITALQETQPYEEEVSGVELLDEIEATISRFVIIDEKAISTIALWIVHAWCIEVFSLSPFLRINSPTKGCGKTTLLMLMSELLPKCLLTANVTTASMFRLIDKLGISIGIDEADGAFKENPELLSLVNASYTRKTAQVPRCAPETNDVEMFSVWGPKVICGIGKLPPTTEDRSIIIKLIKKKNTEKMERFRFDRLDAFEELKRKLKRFSDDNIEALKEAVDPELPDQLGDRPADNWRPLIMIADITGGDWPYKARNAALTLHDSQEDEELLVHLLRDIKAIFNQLEKETKVIQSAELAHRLTKMEGSPWSSLSGKYKDELTPNRLARMLAPLGIKPRKFRFSEKTAQGYRIVNFDDVFARYSAGGENNGDADEEIDWDKVDADKEQFVTPDVGDKDLDEIFE